MTRLLTCGEAFIGLTTAAASLPGVTSPSTAGSDLLLVGLLGVLPMVYSLAAAVLARVTSEAPCFTLEDRP